jgi:hypothetical protein
MPIPYLTPLPSSNIVLFSKYLILKYMCSDSVYILGVSSGVLVKTTVYKN